VSGSRIAAVVLGALTLAASALGAGSRSARAADGSVVSPMPDGARQAAALYDAAYDRWTRLALRPYATYDSTISIARNGRTKVRRYAVAFRRSDNRCLVVGVPVDARDRPDPATVTQRCFGPDYAFTFVPQVHGNDVGSGELPIVVATPDPTPTPDPRVIGRVTARNRPYDVSLVGDETMDGVATAHLRLVPIGDPAKHVLRDVWIDRRTNGVVALDGEARLPGRVVKIDFRAHYDEDGEHETLRRVDGRAKAQLLIVTAKADVSYDLSNYTYPEAIPAWTFDLTAYRKHHPST